MTFKGGARSPTQINKMVLHIRCDTTGEGKAYSAQYAIEVEYDTEETDGYQGDLIPLLTEQERTQAQAFVDTLWARAEDQLGIGE
jgi:hypothetical protein